MSSASDRDSSVIDLSRLAEPFEESDIEWRVSRAGMKGSKIFCLCLAYCTNRAIMRRLDEVCGPANWRNEQMTVHELRTVHCMQVGISIRINGEWITKYDVAEPTNIEPAKGGFSGAMKRAGAQWGIGRYLYQLDETFAEVSEDPGSAKGWNWASLPKDKGGGTYYWEPPKLPGWALPKEPEHGITEDEFKKLKKAWIAKFAPDSKNPSELLEGFTTFVYGACGGEFPVNEVGSWLRVSFEKCMKKINDTTDPKGVSSDVPL